MKVFRTGILLIVPAILMIPGPLATANPAHGTVRSAASGDWSRLWIWEVYDQDGGWRALTLKEGVPGRTGSVTIQAGHTIVVSAEQHVRKLHIQRSTDRQRPGTLEITAGGVLTIHRELSMAGRTGDAEAARIVFSGSSPPGGVLHSMARLAIHGEVEVIGQAGGVIRTEKPTQLIAILPRAKLTATGGPLSISGSLEMDGMVVADGPYRILVNGDGIREGSSGLWKVAHSEGTIKFDTAKDVFLRAGKIEVEQGTFDVATNLKVSRRVTRGENAKINVHPGVAFGGSGRPVDREGQLSTLAREPKGDNK